MQAILYDSLSLFHAYLTCDVIMSLGTVGCFWLPFLKLFSSKKIIVNLDGLDDKRDKWNALARFVIGSARNIAAKKADIIVSDNLVISEYVKDKYKRDSYLIEYGGDNAEAYYNEQELLSYGLKRREYAFKVARIEPENKVHIILEAFSKIPSLPLVIVGNWNKSEYGRKIRSQYKEYSNITLLDPIYEPSCINLLRSNCKIYIHGHSMGGTNPSLVEAMNLALPVIAFDVSYNRSTTENKALYFINSEDLVRKIESLKWDKLYEISKDLHAIALRRYQWNIIAYKYEKLYIT